MKEPLISVIIPIYNTGKKATKLIDFLLTGKYQNLEVIAVDDGSKDDSLKLLKTIKDKRVKVYHKSNGGAASARNYGIGRSTGKYISFIDSDDFIRPDFLPKLAEAITKKDAALAMTGVEYHRVKDNTSFPAYPNPQPSQDKGESRKAYILRLMSIDGRLYSVTNKLFHANIIKDNRIQFDTGMDFAEDTKFVLEYLSYADGKIIWIPEDLFIYNYGTTTSTVTKSSLDWTNWQKSYDYLCTWLGSDSTREERKNLHKVLFRWKISHKLAVARANLPLKQQLRYANIFELILAKLAIIFRR